MENDNNNPNNNQGNIPLIEVHQEQVEVIPEDHQPLEVVQQIEPPEEAVANVIENNAPPSPENPYKGTNGHHVDSRRQCKQIPVCIVNDNQDIIEFVHDMIREDFFPEHSSTLIHVDVNPDLLIPKMMPADDAHDFRKLYLAHNFDRWILPNCYNRIFEKVIWVRPPWSNHIRLESQTFEIGKNRDTGRMNVNSKENYFIAECLFAPTDQLVETKTVTLECVTVANELVATDDNKNHLEEVVGNNDTIPSVLDIDLEFFMTRNPNLFLYNNTNVYEMLRVLFKFTPPATRSDEDVMAAVRIRSDNLREIGILFYELTLNHKLPDLGYSPPSLIYCQVAAIAEELQRGGYDLREIDWDALYDCGHGFGDHGLPHHVTTHAELDVLFKALETFLDSLYLPPRIITISRSDLENFAYIEARVLQILHSKFNCAVPLAFDQGSSVGVDNSEASAEEIEEEIEEEDENDYLMEGFLDHLARGLELAHDRDDGDENVEPEEDVSDL